MKMLVGSSLILEICSGTGYISEVHTICLYLLRIRNYEIFKLYFSRIRLYVPSCSTRKK